MDVQHPEYNHRCSFFIVCLLLGYLKYISVYISSNPAVAAAVIAAAVSYTSPGPASLNAWLVGQAFRDRLRRYAVCFFDSKMKKTKNS